MTKTIVVLGGAFAGIQVAHRLLKHTRSTVADLKVILVTKVRSLFVFFSPFLDSLGPGGGEERNWYQRGLYDGLRSRPRAV